LGGVRSVGLNRWGVFPAPKKWEKRGKAKPKAKRGCKKKKKKKPTGEWTLLCCAEPSPTESNPG